MGNRKKLRRKFFNGEVRLQDLSEDQAKYLDKYIRKMQRDSVEGKDAGITTFKEVPCQKLTGKKALVPVDTRIVEDENGLLYINEVAENNLVVSQAWKDMESTRKTVEARKEKELQEKAVTDLKPTKLGED